MEWLIGFIVLAIVICLGGIYYASTRFHKVYYRLSSEKISKPVKFVLLTDLHDKTFGKQNEHLIKAIDQEQPNAVLIAGDMLTASLDREKRIAETLCTTLAKTYPVYYGIGNHEAKMKWSLDYYEDAYADFIDSLEMAGVHVLEDASVALSDERICICGIDLEKAYYKRGKQTPMDEDYLTQKLGKRDEEHFNILLAHNPEYFDVYEKWQPELILSGHIHGGLIRLPFLGGLIAPSLKLFPKYDGGLFIKNKTTMILSRGLAFHNLGLRMWNRGELVVIDILPTKD